MPSIAILGAGPAGLTAGYEAIKNGVSPMIFEKEADVGGISKTVNYKDYLFDIGGHRFFTKDEEVKAIWHELLPDDFIKRPRLSRIYYRNKFYYYPLRPWNALSNIGIKDAVLIVLSYLKARIRPSKTESNFEDWVSNRFGHKLFEIFFKTYTEKVWGMPCKEIQADWAAQRIRSLSLLKAVLGSFGLLKKGAVTTLIDEFQYPRRGPGQMWNAAREWIERRGGHVHLGAEAVRLIRHGNRITSAVISANGALQEIGADHFLSSLPLRDIILSIKPSPPDAVVEAAEGLRYRDFFTVGLIIDKPALFEDNWIYIHSPEVKVGRMQNFKNWSPDMIPDPAQTSIGMEYFCFETESIWHEPDRALVDMGARELERLTFADRDRVRDGVVIRSPKTYPIYDPGYKDRVAVVRDYLSGLENLQTIGRNGLHRYNNMDHSMLTALYAVRNIMGADLSVWDINVDDDYHEAVSARDARSRQEI